jgi:hypothetical protein
LEYCKNKVGVNNQKAAFTAVSLKNGDLNVSLQASLAMNTEVEIRAPLTMADYLKDSTSF